MKKNMGGADRIVRLLLASLAATLYFTGILSGTIGLLLLTLAIIFVLTSLVSFCPLYVPFGISSCKTSAKS